MTDVLGVHFLSGHSVEQWLNRNIMNTAVKQTLDSKYTSINQLIRKGLE